jgi:hypothetical protein
MYQNYDANGGWNWEVVCHDDKAFPHCGPSAQDGRNLVIF